MKLSLFILCALCASLAHAAGVIEISDGESHLSLSLAHGADACVIDALKVDGHDVLAPGGAYTGVKIGGKWATSRALLSAPEIGDDGQTVRVSGIRYGTGEVDIEEAWTFSRGRDNVTWRIRRTYSTPATVEDMALPAWEFARMDTWSGALLGTGGVAWPKLMDKKNSSYGVHTGRVTFWNKQNNACLRIDAPESPLAVAARFSHQPNGLFSLNFSVTEQPLRTKYELRRFLNDKQDVWAPADANSGADITYVIKALDYARISDRGELMGIDESAVSEICNTIARIGVIDHAIIGSNGWYSGFAVLQEHWLAQLGLAIDDSDYFRNYAATLNDQRDKAIAPDGRVKPRWAHGPGDAAPGAYNAETGFYECQWGQFMDVQPCFVSNVVDLFDFTGDVSWVRGQKDACERVLAYLMRRDSDGDGLFEMATQSHTDAKGSDWLDVVWAAFENAQVNAQMYNALLQWAAVEEVLGDQAHAGEYRAAAEKLKQAFNRNTADGGFWQPDHQWYVHWRDADDSIHGDNLVLPVNFMAIAFGICDDAARKKAILDQVEAAMRKSGPQLFWPACIHPYRQEEGHTVNWPFPNYENGDIFLAWAEVATRAYADYDPAIAIRYIRNVLRQYQQDGLAFQRYTREAQKGAGDDILANNAMPVVGLYRNVYGIIPKYDRLVINPHLTPELNGTKLRYQLRGREYLIELSVNDYKITCDGATVASTSPFAISTQSNPIRILNTN
jgi:hypothetical protein